MESSEVRTKPTIALIRNFLLHLPTCHVIAVCRLVEKSVKYCIRMASFWPCCPFCNFP
jgi:hypothetical protein